MRRVLGFALLIAAGLLACTKGPISRNINRWKGTWNIEKVSQDTAFDTGIFNNAWKRSKTRIDNFGTLTVNEQGEGELYVRNLDYSATDAPVTMSFYLYEAGKAHLTLIGLTVIASENPALPLGKVNGNGGQWSFWLRHALGKERVLEVDYLSTYCGFDPTLVGDEAYFWHLKKVN